MPLKIDPALIDALVKRQIDAEDMQQRMSPSAPTPPVEHSTLDPKMAMILGSVADGAMTTRFLSKGLASESNRMYAPLKNHPVATGAAVAGTGVLQSLLFELLKDKAPKAGSILNAILANGAATRMNAASEGYDPPARYAPTAPLNDYNTRLTREIGQKSRSRY